MEMSALPTAALSSLEAMLYSLMRGGSGGGGAGPGSDDDGMPANDALASPPPPPLPARPTPRGRRHPSRSRLRIRGAGPWAPPPLIEEDDARTGGVPPMVEELERKAAEVEAQLRRKEEENAALKRRIESYHIRWLEYEIRIKSLEEAFHEQMAALQIAEDAARRAEETAYGRRDRELSDPHVEAAEEPPVRLWPGRDRMLFVGGRRSVASRLGAEFRGQSHALERAAEAAPADDLKKLKAQFRAWTKDYKARLRRAKAEADRDRRHRGASCWI